MKRFGYFRNIPERKDCGSDWENKPGFSVVLPFRNILKIQFWGYVGSIRR
jgi:hypothetical protein